MRIEFTQKLVRYHFIYNDGALFWKNRFHIKARCKIGSRAGQIIKGRRYIVVKTNYQRIRYTESRLIFLYHFGYMPEFIDHINRNPLDNRIENLRPANYSQNNINVALQKNNTSGYKGVSLEKRGNRKPYRAIIAHRQIGAFDTIEEAAKAYDLEAIKLYGEYAVTNFDRTDI